MDGDWIDRFKGLSRLPEDIRRDLVAGSRIMTVDEGALVFSAGQQADNLLLLLSGTVRVQQRSDTGREVTLYRVYAGESCVLTTACMLAFEEYAAEGVAEAQVTAAAIPRKLFDDLLARSSVFREFVFAAYSRRITDLFTLIDDIVFQRMDVRLATRLLELAGEGDTIRTTHAGLAAELGTAREVVSRILAEFGRRGWVDTQRGEVQLTDRPGLEGLVRSAAER